MHALAAGLAPVATSTLETVKYWYGDHAPLFFTLFVIATLAITALGYHASRRRAPAAVPADRQGVLATFISGTTFLATKYLAGMLVFTGLAIWIYDDYRLFTLDMSNPAVWVGVFLLRDLIYYWVHRAEHRTSVLWASHMVHHSSQTISPVTALRVPWMEALYKPWLSLWMPLIGFNPIAAVCLDVLAASIGQLQHTTRWRRHSPLDWVAVTPSTHRVHHGSNPGYVDKNFGAVFVIWDRLFGSYAREREAVRYGILGTALVTPTDMLRGGYPSLWASTRAQDSTRAKLATLFGPPHPHGTRHREDARHEATPLESATP